MSLKKMKTTALLTFVLLICIEGKSLDSYVREIWSFECSEQVGIDRKIVDEAMKGNIPPFTNEKYKEFLTCYYKKQNYQNEHGAILIQNIKKFLSQFYTFEDLENITICKAFDGDSHGDIAYNALQCILEQLRDLTPYREN